MQALWMVLAAFLFASMGVCVKIASQWFSAAELVFYRGLIGMGLLALLVAVFPANVYMAQHPERFQVPAWLAWARLPFQPLLLWWVWRVGRPQKS